jgi:homoserine dehydrogenase
MMHPGVVRAIFDQSALAEHPDAGDETVDTACQNEIKIWAVVHEAEANLQSAHVQEASLALQLYPSYLRSVTGVGRGAGRVETGHSALLDIF